MTLKDAIAKYVHSGDHLALGGFTTGRKPYAAVYEILRQGITDLTGLPVLPAVTGICSLAVAVSRHISTATRLTLV